LSGSSPDSRTSTTSIVSTGRFRRIGGGASDPEVGTASGASGAFTMVDVLTVVGALTMVDVLTIVERLLAAA
jgi:hypothetical protein